MAHAARVFPQFSAYRVLMRVAGGVFVGLGLLLWLRAQLATLLTPLLADLISCAVGSLAALGLAYLALQHFQQLLRQVAEQQQAIYTALEREIAARHAELAAANQALEAEIATQRQMEKALSASETLFRSVIEQSYDAVVIADENGHIVVWNSRATQISGLQAEAAIGRPLWEVYAALIPDDMQNSSEAEYIQTRLVELFNKSDPAWMNVPGDLPLAGPDKTRRMIQAVAFPLRLPHTYSVGIICRDITLHNQAEKAQFLLTSLVESSSDAIIGKSLEGIILGWNTGAQRIYGYTAEEVLGKSIDMLAPAERHKEVWYLMERIRQGERVENYETIRLTKSGVPLHVALTSSPIQDSTGRITGAATITRDITAQKHTEETLRRRATQLAILNDVGSQIAAILDLERIFNRVTQLVQTSFGYHHVGLFTFDKAHDAVIMAARSGEFAHLFPANHMLKLEQGMVGWVGLHGRTLLANDVTIMPQYVNLYPGIVPTQSELSVPLCIASEIVGVLDIQSPKLNAFDESDVMLMETLANQVAVAIANARLYQEVQHELQERKNAEMALRESESRYHTISDIISDVAYGLIVHADGRLEKEWVTEGIIRLKGVETDAPSTESNWRTFVHPEDISKAYEALTTLLSGRAYECEIRFMRNDGPRWLYTRNRPVWDEAQQRVVRIIGAAQDITDQKNLERQMVRAERLTAMGYITGTLAHEIKNPLQAIHSNLELVLDFPLEPDERDESLQVCRNEVERLIEITQSVLSMIRPGQGNYEPVDLAQVLQQTLELLKHPLERAAVCIISELPASLPAVLGDHDQLRQVFLNLILNAIEALTDGGTLVIMARIEPPNLHLDFINNGPPIPSHQIEHIFEPFFTTKPTGVGLGLFISHHFIQQHGGILSAQNLPDEKGVEFSMILPLLPSEENKRL